MSEKVRTSWSSNLVREGTQTRIQKLQKRRSSQGGEDAAGGGSGQHAGPGEDASNSVSLRPPNDPGRHVPHTPSPPGCVFCAAFPATWPAPLALVTSRGQQGGGIGPLCGQHPRVSVPDAVATPAAARSRVGAAVTTTAMTCLTKATRSRTATRR